MSEAIGSRRIALAAALRGLAHAAVIDTPVDSAAALVLVGAHASRGDRGL